MNRQLYIPVELREDAPRQPAKNPRLGSADGDGDILTRMSLLTLIPDQHLQYPGTRADQRCVVWNDPMDGNTIAKH